MSGSGPAGGRACLGGVAAGSSASLKQWRAVAGELHSPRRATWRPAESSSRAGSWHRCLAKELMESKFYFLYLPSHFL